MSDSGASTSVLPPKEPASQTTRQRKNTVGTLAIAGAIVFLLIGILAVSTSYAWDSPQALGCFLLAGELALLFLISEQMVAHPLFAWKGRDETDMLDGAQSFASAMRASVTKEKTANLILIGILFMTAFFYLCQISQNGIGNIYYAATTKSMLMNWHNFFFVSFEPSGFVAMDKPPLSLWLQTASAKLFGLNGMSLMLPQLVAGIASVAVLYHLVRRAFGAPAGLLSALFLALMPITITSSRATHMDGLLTLVVLLGAWAVVKAAETGSLRWLLLSMVLVGLGFNIKMMEAYLVLPAFLLLYLLTAPRRRLVRVGQLVLALLVLVIVSFSWVMIVDSVAPGSRPYVGSSGNNSELGLALGYNGVGRSLGAILALFLSGVSEVTGAKVMGDLYALAGGPLRLLTTLGDQVNWLLPLAVVGLFASDWRKRRSGTDAQTQTKGRSRQRQAFILWVTWLIAQSIFFTLDVLIQSYYLVILAPSVAALAGISVVVLWHDYRRPGWRGWLLPVSFLLTAVLQVSLIAAFPNYATWLTPIVIAASLLAAGVLVWLRVAGRTGVDLLPSTEESAETPEPPRTRISFAGIMCSLGVIALLLAPTVWSVATIQQPANGLVPVAGPEQSADSDPFILLLQGVVDYAQVDPKLVSYLEEHQGDTHYLVATSASLAASPFIFQTGKPALPLGGFNGNDHILTVDQLKELIDSGKVRYFWMSPFYLSDAQIEKLPARLRTIMKELVQLQSQNPNNALLSWVSGHCAPISQSQWGGSDTGSASDGAPQLYDCANHS